MKAYIVETEGNEDLFVEESEHGLTIRSQDNVFKHIFDFIKKEYTLAIKIPDIESVCKAAIELFDSLKTKDSQIDGIVRKLSRCI